MRKNFINTGAPFERMLEQTHTSYLAKKRAKIEKVAPPTRMVRRGAFWIPLHMENPFLDFVGVWSEAGCRALMMEAKSTRTPRLAVGSNDGLNERQWRALRDWHASGCAACVLWEFLGVVKLIMVEDVHEQIKSRKSLAWTDCKCEVRRGIGFVHYDWLTTLRERMPV